MMYLQLFLLILIFALLTVGAQDCASIQLDLNNVQSSLDNIKHGVKVAAIVVPILGGLLLIVLVLALFIAVRVVFKIKKKLPLPEGWGFIRFVRNIDQLQLTLNGAPSVDVGLTTGVEASADLADAVEMKKRSKSSKDEIKDDAESRKRIIFNAEEDSHLRGKLHGEFELKFTQMMEHLSIKNMKRISASDLGSMELASRGLLHTTLKAKYSSDSVVFRRYSFPTTIDDDTDKLIKEYLEEDERRRKINHRNVAQYIGFCFDMPHLGFVTRHYSQGSLYDVLIGHRKRDFTQQEIGKFAVDVAAAVKAYHDHGFSVRIVATRNVMLDDTMTPHLEFNFEPSSIDFKYGKQRAYVGAVSWLAPEVLETKIYTLESDSFSFGVFLWELFARSDPFAEKTTIEVACPVIHKGLRLKTPSNVPESVASLMEGCFRADPMARPSIEVIQKTLSMFN